MADDRFTVRVHVSAVDDVTVLHEALLAWLGGGRGADFVRLPCKSDDVDAQRRTPSKAGRFDAHGRVWTKRP